MQREKLMARLRGCFPALITPLTPDEELDHRALAANLRWMGDYAMAGYLLLGSTGEQQHLSEFERALVVEVARRHVPEERLLLVGTGMAGTRTTIEETRRAAEAGADAALVVTPSYYQKGMSSAALTHHFLAVAEASPIPILLYSVPAITGVTIPPETVGALAGHPNVVGMKNSSGEAQLAAAYRLAAGDAPFCILAGSAYAAAPFLMAGLADGLILAAANVLPAQSVALFQAAQQGDWQSARAHSLALARISETVGRFGIAGWKAGVECLGQQGGPVRGPLRALSDGDRAQVAAWMAALSES